VFIGKDLKKHELRAAFMACVHDPAKDNGTPATSSKEGGDSDQSSLPAPAVPDKTA
jgi:hypothetical protein